MKNFKKILILFSLFFSIMSFNSLKAEEGYMFGGLKVFNYGIEASDLQVINTSLVNLGFSSSTSSTDNTGVGFDLGLGVNLSEELALEVGYVDYGTLEINTTLTGPAETLTTEIDGDGFTGAGVLKLGDESEHAYVKAGFHSWSFTGKVTSSLGSSSEPLGTGTDPFFAIGFKGNNWFASYDYYAIEEGDISSVSVGYSAPF
tara:strand:+ start:682 stop:1287 length:606 start_codon:yes stop_codon:yes gene_type:complete